MSRKNCIIPFRWLPASWGLVGKPFKEAEAHYHLEGEDLERALVDIFHDDGTVENQFEHLELDLKYSRISDQDYDLAVAALNNGGAINPYDELDISLKYGDIDEYEYDKRTAELDPYDNEVDRKVAYLTVEFKHGKIERLPYDKQCATLRNEPWVGTIDNGYDPEEGINGFYFQLDWNEQWVDFLRKNGYHGFNDEQIVEQWFSDVCRSQVESQIPNEPIPFNSNRVINRIPRDNGAEYS